MSYVTHSEAGEGLLFYGNVILPFVDKFPTDTIINRDCLTALKELPDESVHCCVTSPPYYALRDYGIDRTNWTGGHA